MNPDPNHPDTTEDRFERLSHVARRVQVACRDATTNVVDLDQSVRRLARKLAISPNLAWKLVQVVRAEEDAEIIAAMPGTRAQSLLLTALGTANPEPAPVESLALAFESYRDTLATLDIDSRELAVMASGGLDQFDRSQRLGKASRRITEGYAELLGHRFDLVIVGAIAFESIVRPGMLDLVGYELFHGVTRLRPGGPIRLRNAAWARDRDHKNRDPDDLRAVPEACTDDLDENELVVVGEGDLSAMYASPSVGRDGPITVGFTQVHRAMGSITRDPEAKRRRRLGYQVSCSPVRTAQVEYLQPRHLPPVVEPAASSDLSFSPGATLESMVRYDAIPFQLQARAIDGSTMSTSLDAGQRFHEALVAAAAAQAGVSISDLVGHRVVQDHPPMSSSLTLSWDPSPRDG